MSLQQKAILPYSDTIRSKADNGMSTTKQWLRYWRNALADAESRKGAMTLEEWQGQQKVAGHMLEQGKVGQDILDSLFREEPQDCPLVKVAYRPTAYTRKTEHNKKLSGFNPEVVTPIVFELWVGREGQLLPASPPVIPRDLLSPQPEDTLTLSSVQQLDDFLDRNALVVYSEQDARALLAGDQGKIQEAASFQGYMSFSRVMFDSLCDSTVLNKHYVNQRSGALIKVDDSNNSTRNILKLYDHLSSCKDGLPLLENYVLANQREHLSCIDPLAAMAGRSGHPNPHFPLAKAQRDALAQTLVMEEGEILAVNGPPGTGKTTFVLSVVSALWVDAALNEQEPPLIIAASTNNQAVTNIIEAFGKDFGENGSPFSGRWLPEVDSYGGYFPAASRENEAARVYQTASFYRAREHPAYLEEAETAFLNRARAAFQKESLDSVAQVRQHLHQELQRQFQRFEQVQHTWQSWKEAQAYCAQLIGADPEATTAAERAMRDQKQQELDHISRQYRQWKRFCADEPLWLALFHLLPPVARRRRLRHELFVEETLSTAARTIVAQGAPQDPGALLRRWIEDQRQALDEQESRLQQWETAQEECAAAQRRWQQLAAELGLAETGLATLDEVDQALDVTLRFALFQLAVHYWEARWLLDCHECEEELARQAQGKEKTGLKSVRPRWKRRMKLTPCIVSTLHSLPGHMTYSVFEEEGQFSQQYLLNEVDLLIIDEAGQVAPDIAGAAMALARRALVIGDVHQIKPVCNLGRGIDVGNMMEQQLLSSQDEYASLCETGRGVIDGSVMRIAQAASRYHYLAEAEPGMYLREHRRCFDEIISFCNALCYQGLLQPRRGSADKASGSKPPLPALGYLHIDGKAESLPAGSRINRLEAITIAGWLSDKREELEACYGQPLEDIAGVITPFRAQALLISEECEKRGISIGRGKGKMTIGTVHALQGAERAVVLFSSVYSRHADGYFIDSDPAMLNVAVSRAKDSFLVFGDMEVISSASKGSPRHQLGLALFARQDGELRYAIDTRPDLLALCQTPRIINDSEQHDACFLTLLKRVERRVDIVSPWLSWERLHNAGFVEAIRTAARRGVSVHIYTDYRFNIRLGDRDDPGKKARLRQCCEALRDCGAQVYVLNQVHSKLLMADERFMCVGSYNWGSAAREGIYKNMERSVLYSGNLAEEIQTQLHALHLRIKERYEAANPTSHSPAKAPCLDPAGELV
ncbi:AAA domain-containing protein [Zobellella iuensis]|uniref:PLD phosphodiesterase domain-containing protein n=1 Tax=Zobellella iuensis TaxID=2803811 RepID=A0ABS1QSB7_9GAMM|nr:AAA domain-containing protein [Zobellella iuensis]MBL1377676.1 hypothetical protein [Zobellella iuensis]